MNSVNSVNRVDQPVPSHRADPVLSRLSRATDDHAPLSHIARGSQRDAVSPRYRDMSQKNSCVADLLRPHKTPGAHYGADELPKLSRALFPLF